MFNCSVPPRFVAQFGDHLTTRAGEFAKNTTARSQNKANPPKQKIKQVGRRPAARSQFATILRVVFLRLGGQNTTQRLRKRKGKRTGKGKGTGKTTRKGRGKGRG